MLKQKNPYGCGLYAVANACNLDNFATDDRVEASKSHGSSNGMLSKYLLEDGTGFYMQPLFYDAYADKLPKDQTEYKVTGDVLAFPLVLCCKLSENGLWHMIGAHLDRLGMLYVYDSLRDDVFETTLPEVHNYYHSVFGLYAFCDLNTGEYAFIK